MNKPAMKHHLALPEGGAARLHEIRNLTGFPWLVIIAASHAEAVPAVLTKPGAVCPLLTHAAGVSWPNRTGEALALAALADGGAVALGFVRLADAASCKARLEGAAR